MTEPLSLLFLEENNGQVIYLFLITLVLRLYFSGSDLMNHSNNNVIAPRRWPKIHMRENDKSK